MAALSITTTQVLPTVNDPTVAGIAGEAITVGQAVYYDAATGKWLKAQCDGTAAEAGADGYGIALSSAPAANQPLVVALPGHRVTLGAGAAPLAGVVYYIGATAGAINPVGDLASTNKVLPLCIGIGSNKVLILTGAYNAGAVLA
jgi:hypothetical protein